MGNTKRKVIHVNLEQEDLSEELLLEKYNEFGPSAFIINITRDMVLKRECKRLHQAFDTILDCDKALECNFLLNIKGYEYKLDELWKIPEVVRYLKEAFMYRPLVLSRMSKEAISLVFAAHSAKTNKSQTGFYLSEDRAKDFIISIYNSTSQKERPIVFKLARRVEKLLDIYVIP